MKTKIKLLLILCFVLNSFNSFSQKYYISLFGGYGFSTASTTLGGFVDQNSNSAKLVKGSYGNGIQAGGIFGYNFTENISGDIALSNLFGSNLTTNNQLFYNGNHQAYFTSNYKSVNSGNVFRIIPSIKLTIGNGVFKPYAKFGIVIGLANKIVSEESVTLQSADIKRTTEYSGGSSFGFSSALGSTYKINETISVLCEIALIAQSYAPAESKVVRWTENGVDKLPSVTISDKQTQYVDNVPFPFDPLATRNSDNQPRQELKLYG